MKMQELRKLIREEIKKENMGKTLEVDHYLELLNDLKETNQIHDEQEVADFVEALRTFADQIDNQFQNLENYDTFEA